MPLCCYQLRRLALCAFINRSCICMFNHRILYRAAWRASQNKHCHTHTHYYAARRARVVSSWVPVGRQACLCSTRRRLPVLRHRSEILSENPDFSDLGWISPASVDFRYPCYDGGPLGDFRHSSVCPWLDRAGDVAASSRCSEYFSSAVSVNVYFSKSIQLLYKNIAILLNLFYYI